VTDTPDTAALVVGEARELLANYRGSGIAWQKLHDAAPTLIAQLCDEVERLRGQRDAALIRGDAGWIEAKFANRRAEAAEAEVAELRAAARELRDAATEVIVADRSAWQTSPLRRAVLRLDAIPSLRKARLRSQPMPPDQLSAVVREARERLARHDAWRPTHPEAECDLGGCDECFHGTPAWGPSDVRVLLAALESERRENERLSELLTTIGDTAAGQLVLLECPYLSGEGTCVSGCREEPACMTEPANLDSAAAVLREIAEYALAAPPKGRKEKLNE
jgi:hypothetical protein